MITNETVMKAAEVAGLCVQDEGGVVYDVSNRAVGEDLRYCRVFDPVEF